jgi:prolyl oligopeptidase
MTTLSIAEDKIDFVLERSGGIIDTYHGVEVPDPFRWLEEHQAPRTRAWIDQQAATSRAHLDQLPGREILAPRIAELLDHEAIGEIRKSGQTIYCTKRLTGEEQARLYKRDGIVGIDEVLIDPATLGEGSSLSITIVDISPDGRLLAYGVRSGGQGARRVRILDLVTRETLPDELPKGALRGFNFLPEGNGFFYVTEEVGKPSEPKAAKRHFLGQPLASDKTVFYGGRASNLRLVAGLDAKSCTAVHTVIRAVGGRNLTTIHLQMLCKCGNPLLTLVEDSPDPWDARIHGEDLYLFLNRENGEGRKLIRVPLSAPDISQAQTVLLEGAQRIQSWRIFGDRILTTTVEHISTVLRMYDLYGTELGLIELSHSGTASILEGDSEGCFYSFESYTHAREVYYYEFASGHSTLFSSPSRTLEHIAYRRIEYPSHDGTLVPLTLLGRKEVLESGNAPALLTAYGAAGVCLTPQHSFLATCFVELGGVFAIAHIRGGGEHGRAWEEAGKRHNRPNVHRDFIAGAEYLASSGVADRDRIAIAGGSNSGLLVGTAMTQRPDLFQAVVCLAPIIDMLRYHRFDNTQFYIPQFGSAENREDFPILLSYSPYHNVIDGIRYPALLMISGDADTRCDPMHARKFVARLQAAISSLPQEVREDRPILLDWNPLRGHFATLPLATRAAAIVDRLAFLCHHLKMEVA